MGVEGWRKGLNDMLGDLGIKDTNGFFSSVRNAFRTGDNSGLIDFVQKNVDTDLPCETCCRPCRLSGGDFCARCVELQQPFAKGLQELRTMEAAIDAGSAGAPQKTAPTSCSCSLCGAPYEENETECPWCGTPYPPGAGIAALPSDIGQLKLLYRRRCEEVWGLYNDFYNVYEEEFMNKFRGNLLVDNPLSKRLLSLSMQGKQKMTSEQILANAEHYNVPVSAYLLGVVTNQYFSTGVMAKVESLQQRGEALDRMNEISERNLQIEREKNEKLRAIRLENAARQINQAASHVGHYVGGGGSSGGDGCVCGHCVNYLPSGRCAAEHGHNGFTTADRSGLGCRDYNSK